MENQVLAAGRVLSVRAEELIRAEAGKRHPHGKQAREEFMYGAMCGCIGRPRAQHLGPHAEEYNQGYDFGLEVDRSQMWTQWLADMAMSLMVARGIA